MTENSEKSLNNTFVAKGLEREHNRRKDPDWLARKLNDPETFFMPIGQSKVLVVDGEAPAPVLLNPKEFARYKQTDSAIFLGERKGRAYFAVALDKNEFGAFEGAGQFRDLRAVAPLLSRDDGAILAYAQALTYWHSRNRFCGACGAKNEIREGGHSLACANPRCGAAHFPRTDPAIIVLIRCGEKCLLARQQTWAQGIYSVLAGFVEPGESIEAAVAREIFEEAGVRVGNIRYHSSQPWPFPCSLMLGFTADAEDDRITLGDSELEDARWFGRRELQEAVEKRAVKLPTPVSISYRLIEDWFDAEGATRLRDIWGRHARFDKKDWRS
ncbi:MAG: NAD(+) diphosphatase [Deltaproteobacteria bacterium]|jgi:NAD+ diphosphatase|nr:NAD(+) diphosphatase [Deltaproteobacteria bacterium]MDA8305326.1 NAD(+) diphosphatase [Deltaproteobacteria bacterium]